MDMLEDSIKRYHNKILSAAEVIEELIKVSKEITAGDKQAADNVWQPCIRLLEVCPYFFFMQGGMRAA